MTAYTSRARPMSTSSCGQGGAQVTKVTSTGSASAVVPSSGAPAGARGQRPAQPRARGGARGRARAGRGATGDAHAGVALVGHLEGGEDPPRTQRVPRSLVGGGDGADGDGGSELARDPGGHLDADSALDA